MEVDLLSFVGYFILYLLVGFVLFSFVMYKKPGSNVVSTICLMAIILSLGIGFMSAVHLGFINLFLVILALWFSYIVVKMNKQDRMEKYANRNHSKKNYYTRMKRKFMEERPEDIKEEE